MAAFLWSTLYISRFPVE